MPRPRPRTPAIASRPSTSRPEQTLVVIGTAQGDAIAVKRNAAGRIVVNGGAVPILGTKPTVDNTTVLEVFGQGGSDDISFDESNGALPNGLVSGGDGTDTVTFEGGAASETFMLSRNGVGIARVGRDHALALLRRPRDHREPGGQHERRRRPFTGQNGVWFADPSDGGRRRRTTTRSWGGDGADT